MKLYNTVRLINKRYNGEEGYISKIFPAGELADKIIYEIKFSGNNNSGQFSEEEFVVMNSYRHFYLYAKHWYKRTDVVEDLKLLIQNRSLVDPIHLSVRDVIDNLEGLAWNYITKSGNPPHFFREFVFDMFPDNRWKHGGDKEDSQEITLIKKILSMMSIESVKNIDGNLGEPDPKILPLSEGALDRIREMRKEFPE